MPGERGLTFQSLQCGALIIIFVLWEWYMGDYAIVPLYYFKRRSQTGATIEIFFIFFAFLLGVRLFSNIHHSFSLLLSLVDHAYLFCSIIRIVWSNGIFRLFTCRSSTKPKVVQLFNPGSTLSRSAWRLFWVLLSAVVSSVPLVITSIG
jgi:hypothetical protein